jgi:hypothetical protein
VRQLIFIFICTTITVGILKAQTTVLTHFGIKGGYNRSWIKAVDSYNQSTGFVSSEFYAGFFCESKIGERMLLVNELIYSSTVGTFNYLEIPMALDYRIYNKLRCFLGGKLDLLLDNYTETEAYYLYHISLSLEGGVRYPITKRFTAEARYGYGITRQLNDYYLDVIDGRRRTLRVGIGYTF